MQNKENEILDNLINKTTLAAEQLLNTDDLEVKLAKNMTEEDEKNPNVIALEKLISITEKLNNMHTKRINIKLKQEKMQKLANGGKQNSSKIQSNFADLTYQEKLEILYNDQDFYKAMHDFPKHAIAKKYFGEALGCIEDEQAYKAVIHKMIDAERLTLQYLGEVGIIKKLSKKELNKKLSPRFNEINERIQNFRKEENEKNKEIFEKKG